MSPMLRRAVAAVLPAIAVAITPSLLGIHSRTINKESAIDKASAVDKGSSDGEFVAGSVRQFQDRDNKKSAATVRLGVMNKHGVTRYTENQIKIKHSDRFYWPGPGARDSSEFTGATDLAENVSWGWHHPSGVYNTIPVGSPLIDGDLNIYLGSDDAIRKFSVLGDLLWSYAPRGQLAAAPSLLESSSSRRESGSQTDATAVAGEDPYMEKLMKPSWVGSDGGVPKLTHLRVGGRLRVRPGMQFVSPEGKEYYREGDVGTITEITDGEEGSGSKAKIQWKRTGHVSIAHASALEKRFRVVLETDRSQSIAATPMLVGTTTSGYVFAIDMATGEELWATQACEMISGVKGAVSGKAGVVVAATDRCTDRYCYRYRNLTNPLAPGNSVVRGLAAADGSALWEFKPTSPVWNFVPQYHKTDGTVMFSDLEGTTYSLDLLTGKLVWSTEGSIGTYTQSAAVYLAATNQLFSMGLKMYEDKTCNPFPAPGILPPCGTWPGKAGWVNSMNATSGHVTWELETPEPPASAAVGMLNSPHYHTRLVIAMGHNCWYNSPTALWAVDPNNGHIRWKRDGPTLWTDMCAGDKEGGDIRRAMGGRATCHPGAWTTPAIDEHGDIYIGNQVGELQRWGDDGTKTWARGTSLLSSLSTGVAFQDNAITFASGIMAVATCTSLIIFQTHDNKPTLETNSTMEPYWDGSMSGVVY